MTFRIDQSNRIQQFGTFIALVSTRIFIATQRTRSKNETVGQELITIRAMQLIQTFGCSVAIFVKSQKDILTDPKIWLNYKLGINSKAYSV
jgi:hypothetical protein